MYGLQWVHYANSNTIRVNVSTSYEGKTLNQEQLQTYLKAAQNQFAKTISESSNGEFNGVLTFNEDLNLGDQFTPNALISEFSNSSGIAAVSGNGTFAASIFNTKGELQPTGDFALDFVHELFHTIRLEHPFEVTQADDTELVNVGPNSFETTEKTDPNITRNIMNYGMIKINGEKLSEIWKNTSGDQITMGQLMFMLGEIAKQKDGAGSWNDPNWEYWVDYPGRPVKNN